MEQRDLNDNRRQASLRETFICNQLLIHILLDEGGRGTALIKYIMKLVPSCSSHSVMLETKNGAIERSQRSQSHLVIA